MRQKDKRKGLLGLFAPLWSLQSKTFPTDYPNTSHEFFSSTTELERKILRVFTATSRVNLVSADNQHAMILLCSVLKYMSEHFHSLTIFSKFSYRYSWILFPQTPACNKKTKLKEFWLVWPPNLQSENIFPSYPTQDVMSNFKKARVFTSGTTMWFDITASMTSIRW